MADRGRLSCAQIEKLISCALEPLHGVANDGAICQLSCCRHLQRALEQCNPSPVQLVCRQMAEYRKSQNNEIDVPARRIQIKRIDVTGDVGSDQCHRFMGMLWCQDTSAGLQRKQHDTQQHSLQACG